MRERAELSTLLQRDAMSQENLEIVRAALAAWDAGDMDAFRELYDPDAVVRPPNGWPEPGPGLELG